MLFGRKKKEQEVENKIRELYSLSIDELAEKAQNTNEYYSHEYDVKGGCLPILEKITGRYFQHSYGLHNDYKLLRFIYFEKLVMSPVEEGGFGCTDPAMIGTQSTTNVPYGDLRRWFLENLTVWKDFYKSHGKYSGGRITNYGLEFIRNYIRAGIKTPLTEYLLTNLAKLYEMDDDELVLTPAMIMDGNCFIYDSRIYDDGTSAEIFHKLKSCIYIHTQTKNGKEMRQFDDNEEPTGKLLTLEDLLDVPSSDVPDFLSTFGFAE